MDFDSAADTLYAVAPEGFVAQRNELARQARSGGDRLLAQRIDSLRKPTVAAWLANQLVRERPDQMRSLLDLGRELREVMADLPAEELRELSRQRFRIVAALLQEARAVAAGHDRKVSDQAMQALRETLEATLSDSSSAEAVAQGRLSEPVHVSGFGSDDDATGMAAALSAMSGATVTDLDSERRRRRQERATRVVAAAEMSLRRGRARLEAARAELEQRHRRTQQARHKLERLEEERAQATSDLEARQKDEQAALDEISRLEAELASAERVLADARGTGEPSE